MEDVVNRINVNAVVGEIRHCLHNDCILNARLKTIYHTCKCFYSLYWNGKVIILITHPFLQMCDASKTLVKCRCLQIVGDAASVGKQPLGQDSGVFVDEQPGSELLKSDPFARSEQAGQRFRRPLRARFGQRRVLDLQGPGEIALVNVQAIFTLIVYIERPQKSKTINPHYFISNMYK